MAARIDQPTHLQRTGRRPLWLSILAGFSLLLGIVSAIPQFYCVLFALHIVTIGPNSNPLGQIWYAYILNGDNSYQKVDPGILAGAIEDAFLLGPLWLVPVLLFRRSLFVEKESGTSRNNASGD